MDRFQKNAKKVNFFTIWVVLRENRSVKRHFLPRVRDWKGYGVWYKCGTCEPLQSPTGLALEMR